MGLFRPSSVSAECERCGERFDPAHGGVCSACGRILCGTHLYGTWVQKARTFVGLRPVCVYCRAGVAEQTERSVAGRR